MKLFIFALFCVVALPANALDVSVVNGQSRVTGTLHLLRQKVEDLKTHVDLNTEGIAKNAQTAKDALNKATSADNKANNIRTCGNSGYVAKTDGSCSAPVDSYARSLAASANDVAKSLSICSCPARSTTYYAGSKGGNVTLTHPASSTCSATSTAQKNIIIGNVGFKGMCSINVSVTARQIAICTKGGWVIAEDFHPVGC